MRQELKDWLQFVKYCYESEENNEKDIIEVAWKRN